MQMDLSLFSTANLSTLYTLTSALTSASANTKTALETPIEAMRDWTLEQLG